MMDYRQVNFVTLVFGIIEYKTGSKKPFKRKEEVNASVIGSNLEEIVMFNKGIESKYKKVLGLKDKSEIKLINFKLIHNQGKTVYML